MVKPEMSQANWDDLIPWEKERVLRALSPPSLRISGGSPGEVCSPQRHRDKGGWTLVGNDTWILISPWVLVEV